MVKIFISQPMRGKTPEEIKDEREKAIKSVEGKYGECEVIDSYFEDYPKGTTPSNIPLSYLGRSILKLAEADVAVFIGDWENYRGCRIENTCALEYGLEVIDNIK